ncbi:MAG: glycosyltransferase family 39 protein [Armatimonadota bacterium]|nr:glycosyltransferase family 39 protein [Armatimonadota bacterium]
MTSDRRAIGGALLLAGWVAVVLGAYYLQLWRLIAAGPSAWWRHTIAVAETLGPVAAAATGLLCAVRLATRSRRVAAWRRVVALALGAAGVLGVIAVGEFTLPWALPGAPAFGEAVTRTLRGVAGATAVVVAASVVGEGTLRLLRWQPDDHIERLLFRAGCGLGAFAYLTLGLAALGLYTPGGLRVIAGGLAAAGFASAAVTTTRRAFAGRRGSTNDTPTSGVWPARLNVWHGVLTTALIVGAAGALAPEREYDALWYHLTFPAVWLSHGRLVDFPQEYVALYPMTWELLYGTAMAAGGVAAAKLLHFACLGLAALLTAHLTRRVAPGATAALAAALFVTAPTVLWETTTAYVDLALTLHLGLALYALVRYAEQQNPRWAALAALNLGLGLATKHLAFLALILAAGAMAVIRWQARRTILAALAAAVALAAASLAIASPWYARSWVATRNPVFPELYRVFGAPADRWDAVLDDTLNRYEAGFGRPRTPGNLLTLPWDATVHAARYGGALGPLFLILLPHLLLRGPGATTTRALAIVAAGYIALWASPISNFQMRFLVPLVPALAVLAAQGYARADLALGHHRVARRAAMATIVGLLVLNLPPNLPLHERDRAGSQGWLTHVIRQVPLGVITGRESEDRYLRRAVPSYGAWRYINTHLPESSLVLTFTGGDNLYSRRSRLWANTVAARAATWDAPAGADDAALRALRRLRVTHILFDRRQLRTFPGDTMAITQPSFLARWARPEYEDAHTVLYALR